MTSRETLECRTYVTEDALYRRSGDLDRLLHELESRLKNLAAEVHRVLCEGGRMSLEVRTGMIVLAIEAFEAGTDLSQIRALAERISSLKGLIDEYEREIAEGTWMSEAFSESSTAREVLASVS